MQNISNETLIKNCKRLLTFLGDKKTTDEQLLSKGTGFEGLLRMYGMLLDIYGAPRSGMAILFFTAGEMELFKEWVKGNAKEYRIGNDLTEDQLSVIKRYHPAEAEVLSSNSIYFQHSGYYWKAEEMDL